MQDHLSYPMLAYFRSPHDNQSWLSALVSIVDASAIAILCTDGELKSEAEAMFAIGRHVVADLARVFKLSPESPPCRLSDGDFSALKTFLGQSLDASQLEPAELNRLTAMYEPEAAVLSRYLMMALPAWVPRDSDRDNWEASGASHDHTP